MTLADYKRASVHKVTEVRIGLLSGTTSPVLAQLPPPGTEMDKHTATMASCTLHSRTTRNVQAATAIVFLHTSY